MHPRESAEGVGLRARDRILLRLLRNRRRIPHRAGSRRVYGHADPQCGRHLTRGGYCVWVDHGAELRNFRSDRLATRVRLHRRRNPRHPPGGPPFKTAARPNPPPPPPLLPPPSSPCPSPPFS